MFENKITEIRLNSIKNSEQVNEKIEVNPTSTNVWLPLCKASQSSSSSTSTTDSNQNTILIENNAAIQNADGE